MNKFAIPALAAAIALGACAEEPADEGTDTVVVEPTETETIVTEPAEDEGSSLTIDADGVDATVSEDGVQADVKID